MCRLKHKHHVQQRNDATPVGRDLRQRNTRPVDELLDEDFPNDEPWRSRRMAGTDFLQLVWPTSRISVETVTPLE